MEYTPETITELQPNDIFVFGTNQFAAHEGGAARIARERFGALLGIGPMGLIDESYGIITTSFNEIPVEIEFIDDQVKCLYAFARLRPDLKFLVTKIGTGIAGFKMEDIASIFIRLEKERPANIVLPKEFHS